ncbi:MAG: PAS domain S-box protein, partial [Candidatus Binatia bacterium]
MTRLYAFASLGSGDQSGRLYVLVGIPKDMAFAEVNQTLLRNLFWLGVACSLALASAWFIGNKLVVGYVKERARAEEASVRLAAIVESSEDAIIGMTLEGDITDWNSGAEIMYGYTAEEVTGHPITILNPPDRPNELPQVLEIIRNGKGINRFETERIRKDGRRLFVSASLSPIRDHQPKIVGASTIARDITSLRKVDEQLRAHTSQLETLHLLAQEVGETLALEEVLRRALKRGVSATGFDYALVHFVQGVSGRNDYGAGRETNYSKDLSDFVEHLSEFVERKLSAGPWLVEDLAAVPELADRAKIGGIRAMAVLPLYGTKRFEGTLVLMSPRIHEFGAEESQFLQALAQQIGLAVQNASLYETTVRMNQDLQGEIEDRRRAEKTLADFTAMVVHDLRSPLANVVSITEAIQNGLFGAVSEQLNRWLW